MQGVRVGAHHAIAVYQAEQGKVKSGLVVAAKNEQAQEKEPAHKETACQRKIICRILVFFQDKIVLIPQKNFFVGSTLGMPEVGDLYYYPQCIRLPGGQYDGAGSPEGGGSVSCSIGLAILGLHGAVDK